MDKIPSDTILEFNSDTLHCLRQQYDLDKPGRIEEAISLLEDWLKKQGHFKRKEFPRGYLERTIIFRKGSVERAKSKLDNLCTFRTLFPEIFEVFDLKNSPLLDEINAGFLPKLTSNHYRVFALKNAAKRYDNRVFDLYRYFIMLCEYIQAHDYCDGVVLLLDYSEANIVETMKAFNIVDVRDILRVFKEGFGMRIKGIHFLTGSKAIDMLVSLFKQVLSEKVGSRIKAHTTIDTVYEYIPKDILPVEYGGKEKPLIEIHRKYQEVMSSKEFTNYLTEMSIACTDEKLRTTLNEDNNKLMGASGTFRSLQVD
ncbi:alpha-tocopherol transfer protein-like [Maniola hyperantus]|uniref:alpha-tocopherol transfer protein-like n=1 Tax=Aphantopus hyperantus TaxID=2795564 RepID=UPI0015697C77|nr:alpha-tocopherol transfer protein-like [Maniola hyperantus]